MEGIFVDDGGSVRLCPIEGSFEGGYLIDYEGTIYLVSGVVPGGTVYLSEIKVSKIPS